MQDPYAVRCMPQVYGAVEDTLAHARDVLSAAINGVSDNPLIFGEDILSGGNFHAEPVGFVSDFLGDRRRGAREHLGATHRPARSPRQSQPEHVPRR